MAVGSASDAPGSRCPGPRRRDLLAGGVGALGGVCLGGLAGHQVAHADGTAASRSGTGTAAADAATTPGALGRARRPFYGTHQGGVFDRPQAHGVWLGLDLVEEADASTLRRLFTIWTDDAAALMSGRGPLADTEPEMAAVTAGLTITFGVGPGVFDLTGITADRPGWLRPLPAFPSIDQLEERWRGTDLVVQICADSPLTVAHAQWVLLKDARSLARIVWCQKGFREAVGTEVPGRSMRNLFGQVDGMVNPAAGQDDPVVWMCDSAPDWLRGGTSMVLRRIAMNLSTWEQADSVSRELALGRTQATGAPLTGQVEHDVPDLQATDAIGLPVIDTFSHVRRSMPHEHGGVDRFLRRPYTYDEGPSAHALSDAGLLFVAFQADLERQFLPVQRRLAEADRLNAWTTPVGSAVYAIPRGVREGEVLAEGLWR